MDVVMGDHMQGKTVSVFLQCLSVAYIAFVFSHKSIAFPWGILHSVTIEMKYIFLPADNILIANVSQGKTKIVWMYTFFEKFCEWT